MRLIIPIAVIFLLSALVANERNHRDEAERQVVALEADNADLARQLDDADAAADRAERNSVLAHSQLAGTQELHAQELAEAVKQRDEARTQLVNVTNKLDQVVDERNKLREQLATANKQLVELRTAKAEPPKVVEAKKPAAPESVEWFSGDYAAAKAKADKLRRPLFIDFGPDWCLPCTRLKETTFVEPRVSKRLHTEFVPLVLGQGQTADRYGITRFPQAVVERTDGTATVFTPNQDADTFLRQLDEAK